MHRNIYIKQYFLSLGLIISFIFVRSQSDTSTYLVTMNSGTVFTCKMLEIKNGEYIKVIKRDSSVMTLDWESFRDYQVFKEGKSKEQRKTERVKSKHDSWYSCFFVGPTGDTTIGRLRKKQDYSLNQWPLLGITFAHQDETEEQLFSRQFKELFVADEDPEYRKYLVIRQDTIAEGRKVYRVVIDGKCKLLFDEVTVGGPYTMPFETYYIYYNEVLTKVHMDAPFVFNVGFRKKCSALFS